MKNLIIIFIMLFSINTNASPVPYFNKVCPDNPPKGLQCIKVQRGDTWKSLTQDYIGDWAQENILVNINRNNKLTVNNWLIVPKNKLNSHNDYVKISLMNQTDERASKYGLSVIVNPKELAWGLYKNQQLINWGVAISGADKCEKRNGWQKCHSPTGEFKVLAKMNRYYRSTMYPIDCPRSEPCAPMPFALRFRREGEALHMGGQLPGFNASHGCIRLTMIDAQYLNQTLSIGDKIIVLTY